MSDLHVNTMANFKGHHRRGYSLVGILITMAMIVVLMTLYMTSMSDRVSGDKSTVQGTVKTMEEQIQLASIHQAFFIQSNDNRNRFLVPSELRRRGAPSDNTTASLYSAMVASNYLTTKILISPNDNFGWVEVDDDYDFNAYQPMEDQFWDPAFSADLEDVSNVSYAHLPLHGERLRKYWKSGPRFPYLGNRGPKDGVANPQSYTYGRNGQWAGHMLFGDGHVTFNQTFTPGSLIIIKDGVSQPDNLYQVEEGPEGLDAILGFTKEMKPDGPVLQWD